MLLKNPTKSGIKAEAVDPSLRPVVVGVLAFLPTKVGRDDNLDVILICFLFF